MAIFGDNSYGGSAFPGNDARCLVTRFTLTEAATVTSIWMYAAFEYAADNFKGVVLANTAGEPGAVLIVSSPVAVNGNGWYQATASGSLPAGDYWVGLVGQGGHGYGQDAGVGAQTRMANGTFDWASPPSTWPGSDASYDNRMNVYVEYTPAGGSGPEAALAAVATITAALTTGIRPAAALTARATLTATLTTGIRPAAALSAQATASAALTTSIRAAASLASVATLTASLTTAIRLTAAPSSVASLAGALTTSIRLAASPAAVATLQGTLASGAAALSASPGASATLAGSLSTGIRLAAAPSGQATLSASLSTGIRLSAAPASSASVSADLTTAVRLAAAFGATAALTATLSAPKPLDAQLVSVATLTGALTTQVRLAAGLSAQSLLTATLAVDAETLDGGPRYVIRRAGLRRFAVARDRARNFAIARARVRAFTVTPVSNQRFESKDPVEKVKLTFDFTADLPESVTLTGTPSVAIVTAYGIDASPGNVANGAAGLDVTSKKVIVPVQGGLDKVDYRVTVSCATTDPLLVLELDGVLPVRS